VETTTDPNRRNIKKGTTQISFLGYLRAKSPRISAHLTTRESNKSLVWTLVLDSQVRPLAEDQNEGANEERIRKHHKRKIYLQNH